MKEKFDKLKIGSITFPAGAELEHILIPATTGSGKSQVIQRLLNRVMWGVDGDDPERPERAIITDSDGAFMSTRGATRGDILLNPFDRRSVKWNPFCEIQDPRSDFDFFASAMIPTDGFSGQEKDFRCYARDLLRDVMKSMYVRGETNPRALQSLILSASTPELGEYLTGTPTQSLFCEGNEKFVASVISVTSSALSGWSYLAPDGAWSIRRWIKEGKGKCLFLTYTATQIDALSPLIGCWLSLAVREVLSLPTIAEKGVSKRRVWFVMDELDSLGPVQSLSQALSMGRKKGLAAISSIQSISQLRKTYGVDDSDVILACFVSKLIMRQGDFKDAKHWSDYLGQVEEKKTTKSKSASAGMRTGATVGESETEVVKSLVLPSELQEMPKFCGFARISGLSDIRLFSVEPRDWPQTSISPFESAE